MCVLHGIYVSEGCRNFASDQCQDSAAYTAFHATVAA